MTLSQKLKHWSEQKINTKYMPIIFYILLFCINIIITSIYGVDMDTPYMIKQAEDILQNGFTRVNKITYYNNFEITVQQWIYCMLLYFFDNNFGSIGLLIFSGLQQILLFTLIKTKLNNHIKDKFWTYLSAAVICMITPYYYYSVRPENITLILLISDCLILDRYKKTNNIKYLYLLPLITLIEINMHASMYIFHFCILLAYLTPSIFPKIIKSDHIKFNKHIVIIILLMIASLFINPYGVNNITYVFKSLETFKYIEITEQTRLEFIHIFGIIVIIIIINATIQVVKKLTDSTAFYIITGFCVLAMTSQHSAMFMPIAITFMIANYLDLFAKHIKCYTKDIMPNSVLMIIPAGVIIIIAYSVVILPPSIKEFKIRPELEPIVTYIKEQDPDNTSNIICNGAVGSYLEYNDINNILSDTRVEFLNKKINNNINAMHDVLYLDTGILTKESAERFTNIEDYLDKYNIEFIITSPNESQFTYLKAYLNNSDKYKLIFTTDHNQLTERKTMHVSNRTVQLYQRKEDIS